MTSPTPSPSAGLTVDRVLGLREHFAREVAALQSHDIGPHYSESLLALCDAWLASQDNGWRPIESAPRDVLLLFRNKGGYTLGFYDGLLYRNQESGSLSIEPREWMLIPGARYDLFPQCAIVGLWLHAGRWCAAVLWWDDMAEAWVDIHSNHYKYPTHWYQLPPPVNDLPPAEQQPGRGE